MSLIYIAFGIVIGLVSAVAAFLTGHGFLLALAAYAIGGMVGFMLCAVGIASSSLCLNKSSRNSAQLDLLQ